MALRPLTRFPKFDGPVNDQRSRVRRHLEAARCALEAATYQNRYIARFNDKSCNPHTEGAELSFRGAIMKVAQTGRQTDELIAWMRYHHVWPGVEPRTKESALDWFDRALSMAGRHADVPEQLVG